MRVCSTLLLFPAPNFLPDPTPFRRDVTFSRGGNSTTLLGAKGEKTTIQLLGQRRLREWPEDNSRSGWPEEIFYGCLFLFSQIR